MIKNIEKILIIIFLISLPWQTRYIISSGQLENNYWEYGTIALYAIDIIVGALFLLSLRYFKKLKIETWLIIIFAILLLIINLSISLNKQISLWHSLWIIEAFVIILMIKRSSIRTTTLSLIFAISAAMSSFLGIWQFLSQTSPASKWFGLAEHQSNALGTSVIEAVAPDGVIERWLRSYGSLDHPNIFGGLMSLSIIVLIWANLKKTDNRLYRIVSLLTTVILGAGLISSFSRGAWLSLIIGLIVLFLAQEKTWQAIKKSFDFILCLIVVSVLFLIPFYYLFIPRLSNDSRLENTSIIERVSGYKESLEIIKENFWLGSGLGNYGLALHNQIPKKLVWFYQPVHNVFVLYFEELGVLGAVFFVFIIYSYIKNTPKEKRSLAFSLAIALIIIGIFDHWPMSLHPGIIIVSSLIGLSLKQDNF